MFITQKVFKSLINEAYKGAGITVGRREERILLAGTYWGIEVTRQALPNKALAAIIELTGELPADGEMFKATKEGLQYQMPETYWDFTSYAREVEKGKPYTVTNILLHKHPYGKMLRVLQAQDETSETKIISNMFINAVDRLEINEECESYVNGPFAMNEYAHMVFWESEACILTACLVNNKTEEETELLKLLERFDFAKKIKDL